MLHFLFDRFSCRTTVFLSDQCFLLIIFHLIPIIQLWAQMLHSCINSNHVEMTGLLFFSLCISARSASPIKTLNFYLFDTIHSFRYDTTRYEWRKKRDRERTKKKKTVEKTIRTWFIRIRTLNESCTWIIKILK